MNSSQSPSLLSLLTPELKAILLAFYGGARYGIKVRLPHAFITTILFRSNLSIKNQLEIICKTTLKHALSLASFAALYKTILCLLKYLSLIRLFLSNKNKGQTKKGNNSAGSPYHTHHAFLAGLLGGYTIWGRNYSSIHYQILLYLIPRVLIGTLKLLKEEYLPKNMLILQDATSFTNAYPIISSLVWAIVMTLFEKFPHTLQSSLRNSMYEIYRFSF